MNEGTIVIDNEMIKKIKSAIEAALMYEEKTAGKRKLGITGEAGEVLVCKKLGLKLVCDPRTKGFDAIDRNNNKVQIKTRRSESEGLPKGIGRMSRFSDHEFDYALLAILTKDYQLHGIWKASYKNLKPIIDKEQKTERSEPRLGSFKAVGTQIFPRKR